MSAVKGRGRGRGHRAGSTGCLCADERQVRPARYLRPWVHGKRGGERQHRTASAYVDTREQQLCRVPTICSSTYYRTLGDQNCVLRARAARLLVRGPRRRMYSIHYQSPASKLPRDAADKQGRRRSHTQLLSAAATRNAPIRAGATTTRT